MKIIIKSLALSICVCMFFVQANAQTVTLTGNNTNLRYGPSTNSGILSDYYGNHVHYSRGTTFTYAGETRNGFYSIYVNGTKLWVSSQFATINNPTYGNRSYGKSLVINGTDVNFRLKPSLNAGILSNAYGYHIHVPKYTRLPYLGTSGSFFKTKYNGRIVYVHMQFAYVD